MKIGTHSVTESIAKLGAISVLAFSLAACSMGNIMGESPGSSTQFADTTASEGDISLAQSSALPAIATECPPIKVREGFGSIVAYEGNKVGNAKALQYQAVIDAQSRNCVVSNGLITVKMGIVGRLVLGPSPSTNSLDVPLRFTVERDDVSVFSQRYDIPVTVTPPNQSEEFIKVVENVAIPYLGGEDIVIWVGFESEA